MGIGYLAWTQKYVINDLGQNLAVLKVVLESFIVELTPLPAVYASSSFTWSTRRYANQGETFSLSFPVVPFHTSQSTLLLNVRVWMGQS